MSSDWLIWVLVICQRLVYVHGTYVPLPISLGGPFRSPAARYSRSPHLHMMLVRKLNNRTCSAQAKKDQSINGISAKILLNL